MALCSPAEAVAELSRDFWRRYGGAGANGSQLGTDVLALLCGLKPAVMLDYLRRPERSMAALRTLLRQAGEAASVADCDATALLLGDCAWLVRPSLLRNASYEPLFVLLAGGEPRWAAETEAACLRDACERFCRSLCDSLERGEASPELDWSIAPPTLHGALLGYPAVYALHGPAGPLSLELSVLQLRTSSIPPAVISSFSVPTQLLGCEELERRIERWLHCASAAADAHPAWSLGLVLERQQSSLRAVVL